MSTVLLERMTRPDVEAAMARGYDRVIFACGAVEQHGPHLPLFVDAEHGTALAAAVAERLGHALVAPTVRIGISEHHMAFPGTLTLRESTFAAVCEDYVTSLARHGFRHICIVPTHGGNFLPLRRLAPHLDATAGPDCTVTVYTDLIGMIGVWKQVAQTVTGFGDRVGGHADIAETGLMEFLHPDLVARERVESGYQPKLEEDLIARIIADGFKSVTENGILGDARGATAAVGEQCIAGVADVVTRYFASAIDRN